MNPNQRGLQDPRRITKGNLSRPRGPHQGEMVWYKLLFK